MSVKPVIRNPRTGRLVRHPTYEGWVPTESSRLGLTIAQALFVLAAFGPLVAVLFSIGSR